MRTDMTTKAQKARGPRGTQAPPQSSSRYDDTEQDFLSTMYSVDYSLSQTAPLVGRHDKSTTSLLGFDPLLQGTLNVSKEDKRKPTLSIIGVSSALSAEERDPTQSPNASSTELQSELRALASELGKLTPAKPQSHPKKKLDDEKGHWKNPLRAFLSPQVTSKGRTKAQGKSHRRVKSLGSYEEKTVAKDRGISPPPLAESQVPLSSTMMQELWEVQQSSSKLSANDPLEALTLPSLVKPRPTSFLTGTEVQITSEIDATGWQVEIPSKEEFEFTARFSRFLEYYRREECLLDLQLLVGCSYQDLAHFSSGQLSLATEKIAKFHRPIVECLLECGGDLQLVQGYFQSEGPDRRSPDGFREVLVLERQRQFICCFRGTTAEQQGKFDRQPGTIKLADNGGVSVFADRYRATIEFEPKLYAFLDQLMEENPFCDFVFCGHGFGAAMATIAAYRYAWGRPELRVAALVSGSAKAGLNDFRLSAHSLGNLKVGRLELGHVRPLTQIGVHTGHTFRLNLSKTTAPVRAYRFADTKPDPSLMRKLRLNREKTIDEYVNALEDLGETWVKDFHRYDGTGVKGHDNESRWVV